MQSSLKSSNTIKLKGAILIKQTNLLQFSQQFTDQI